MDDYRVNQELNGFENWGRLSGAIRAIQMCKILVATCLLACSLVCGPFATPQGASSRLLPPAEEFRLTFHEDPHSTLPLTASCEGEAEQTLTCRAFVLTLENLGEHTVRLNGLTCREPQVRIYRQIPNSASQWLPVSDPRPDRCDTNWTNTRLRPHESTEFKTRLISPRRANEDFLFSGSYTLRAAWVLFGCTEEPDGSDCLTPLQNANTGFPNYVAKVWTQEPVEVVSNEVRAESPILSNLDEMKFSFEASVIPPSLAAKLSPVCTPERVGGIECAVFHYKLGNVGTRAVLWMQLGCSDFGIFPEYLSDGQWLPVFQKLPCTLNVPVVTAILPNRVVEGNFSLAWGYDISPFRNPGEYTFRLVLRPQACFASHDGSFCLELPHNEPPVTSSQLTVRTR